MGLLPLEFSDCLLDSPYFRENLRAHERQLEQTAGDIKGIERDIGGVVEAARILSRAKRSLASSLASFQFDCLGTTLTDDEIVISNSLREFSRFLDQVEDETDRMLENAHEKFVAPLEIFRKEQIGSVRKTKKDFDKQTARFCAAQDRYVNTSSRREDSLAEAAEALRSEQKGLNAASLEYVYLMHVVQERKKVEFVETIVGFMQCWATYYKHGLSVASDFSNYMNDLQCRVQKTRGNYAATVEQYGSLKQRMQTQIQDPGLLNKMYTRQGYLYASSQGRKNIKLGSQWTKFYCQYQAKTKTLTMISYSQLAGKITTTETIRVHECVCKEETSMEKFRFVVTGEDINETGSVVTHVFQALSDYERKHWVESMGGTWPAMSTLQRIKADSVEDNLNSAAFTFLQDCLAELEARGLNDQGLYRVGGVVSKVKRLLSQGLLEEPPLDLSDPKQWESKTIASAVKQYFRDLSKPIMTHHLYAPFVEAVKHESEERRLCEIQRVLQQLPSAARQILKVLVRHLSRVAANSSVNLMTPSNLGVCFGPTLLRPQEETVASIMDIKFCNEVVEILIQNCDRFFPTDDNNSSPELQRQNNNSEDVPDSRAKRGSSTPLRTNSFSSFSKLSTNSLPAMPGIKELTPAASSSPVVTRGSATERPRSKSHQIQHSQLDEEASKMATVGKQASLPPSFDFTPTTTPLPAPLLKSSTQDDLMASLEMMNLLAADLPSAIFTPLRRSQTMQPSSIRAAKTTQQQQQTRVGGGGGQVPTSLDVTRKPPLPKLMLASYSGLSPSIVSDLLPPSVPSFHRLNSSPSPSSDCSSSAASASSPGTTRTRFSLQQQQNLPLVIHEAHDESPTSSLPPPVPERKYRSPMSSSKQDLDAASQEQNGHRTDVYLDISDDQTKKNDHNNDSVSVGGGSSSLSGSGRGDRVSVASSSSSDEAAANSGGSRYDNVASSSSQQQHQSDGDDEAEEVPSETSSLVSDISSSKLLPESGSCSGTESEQQNNRDSRGSSSSSSNRFDDVVVGSHRMMGSFPQDVLSRGNVARRNRRNRDSGPYENVPGFLDPENDEGDECGQLRPSLIREDDDWEEMKKKKKTSAEQLSSQKPASSERMLGPEHHGMSSIRNLLSVRHAAANI